MDDEASRSKSRSTDEGDAVATPKQTKGSQRKNRKFINEREESQSDSSKNNNSNIKEHQQIRQSGRIIAKKLDSVNFDGELRRFLNPYENASETESNFFEKFTNQLEEAERRNKKGKTRGVKVKPVEEGNPNNIMNISTRVGDTETGDQSFCMEVELPRDEQDEELDYEGSSDSEQEADREDEEDQRKVVVEQASTKNSTNEKLTEKEKQLAEFERLKQRPDVKEFLNLMADPGTASSGDVKCGGARPKSTKPKQKAPKPRKQQEMGKQMQTVPMPQHLVAQNKTNVPPSSSPPFVPVVKSPSVDTLYVPALKFIPDATGVTQAPPGLVQDRVLNEQLTQIRINDFPEDRADPGQAEEQRPVARNLFGMDREQQERGSLADMQKRAQNIADAAILEAERQHGHIMAPAGMTKVNMVENVAYGVPQVDVNFNDDKNCNATNSTKHVDTAATLKIEKGGFVEMEKLVPRFRDLRCNEEKHWQMKVNKYGFSYYVPFDDRENVKITSFNSWEQAFRVYAAIYTRANPHRGAEIYQYIHAINCASLSFCHDVNYPVLVPIRTDQQIPADFVDISPISRA